MSDQPQPTIYRVGELYNPNRTQWEERMDYNYRAGVHELRLFLSRPRPIEVQQIKQGEANFRLFVEGDILFLLFRFGSLLWGDGSYNWHLVDEEERTVPPEMETPQTRTFLNILLMNADNGLILAIRSCTFSHDFSVALHDAIRTQIEMPFNRVDYIQKIERFADLHPTEDLVKRSLIRCKGGD